jgi:hypothetical protein
MINESQIDLAFSGSTVVSLYLLHNKVGFFIFFTKGASFSVQTWAILGQFLGAKMTVYGPPFLYHGTTNPVNLMRLKEFIKQEGELKHLKTNLDIP